MRGDELGTPVTKWKQTALMEWGAVGLLLVLCVLLVTLQYRWTGELARAEAETLRGNLEAKAQGLAREFDAELTASCEELRPRDDEMARVGRAEAHLASFKRWRDSGARPVFSRIGMAEAAGREVKLSLIDPVSGTMAAAEWPDEWAALKVQFEQMGRGGPIPSGFGEGMLLEFPVISGRGGPRGQDGIGDNGPPGPGGRRGGEHWLILELDRDYLEREWLPALSSRHLNVSRGVVFDVSVGPANEPGGRIWSTPGISERPGNGVTAVPINRSGRTGSWSALPSRSASGVWLLETWPRPGALEELVAGSRRKNLAIGGSISALILAAGAALFFYTRRSRQLAEARMQFVATVSHELRTPLTIICGAAHNLEAGRVPENSIVEYAGMIRRHGEQLRDLVEQVLDFSEAGREGHALRMEPLVTADFVRDALASARQVPAIGACEVSCRIPDDLPAIQGDPEALKRVFLNLLHNAAQHGRAADEVAEIELTAAATDDGGRLQVEITVRDHGPGIPAMELRRVFDVFYRGSAALKKQIRGSGIGLSVVKDIVAAHGGTISAANAPAGGAVFTIHLPATRP